MNFLFASRLLKLMLLIAGIAICFPSDSALGATKDKRTGTSRKSGISKAKKFIILFTNREREKKGLPSLAPSAGLDYPAENQSKNMCAAKLLAHESSAFPKGWQTFEDRIKLAEVRSAAENIAFRTISDDYETWAKNIVRDWMTSPGHRKNLLNPKYKFLGVGVVGCSNKLGYATQVFSSHRGKAP